MKYNELTWGQMEALVNKLGGLPVVHAILGGNRRLEGVEDREQVAFMQSYETSVAVRDLLRGWGRYSSTDGASHFAVLATRVSDRAGNLAEEAIDADSPLGDRFTAEIIEDIDLASRKLFEFEILDGDSFKYAQVCLDEIQRWLLCGNKAKVLRWASALKNFLRGVETLNDAMLFQVDNPHIELKKIARI